MTTFSLPRTLVAGTPENINHVQENFVAVRDHMNGNLDTTNFATSAKPVTLLGPYHLVAQSGGLYNDSLSASGIYVLQTVNALPVANGGSMFGPAAFRFDPADYAVSGLTPKLRLRALVMTNSIDPGANFTPSLRSITASGGGADIHTLTLNATHVTGSDFSINPGASDSLDGTSADFTLPAADDYAFSLFLNVGITANSMGAFWMGLYVHWV